MEKSSFFNSVNGDRKYKAEEIASYFNKFIGNGVFPNPATNLQVISNDNMTVTLKKGSAWINGYMYENTDDLIFNIDVADGVLNRIDRLVLRLDILERRIYSYVKKGVFASSPVAKSLQRDADAYELGLADIRINKGAISITQANITDLRLSTEFCGIVHGAVDQVDTEVLFQDYQSWINTKKGEFNTDLVEYKTTKQGEIDLIQQQFQDDFNTWFLSIQDILDVHVAGNLLSMINEVQSNVSDLQTDRQYQIPVVTGSQISVSPLTGTNKRVLFRLNEAINVSEGITITTDGGLTSLPLKHIDGRPVTYLDIGFVEVVYDTSFFTYVSKKEPAPRFSAGAYTTYEVMQRFGFDPIKIWDIN